MGRLTLNDPSLAFRATAQPEVQPNGNEPLLGGALREKAVWVDESVCIGCRYCAHVATNTFVVEASYGRSRAVRQDGDSTDRIQEAIDTCPVDCIHWVAFEKLDALRAELDTQIMQPLGFPQQKRHRRLNPHRNS